MDQGKLAELHQLIDQWAGLGGTVELETPARVLPEGKRAVRTKSTGDRVYLIDEVAKTKAWITSGEILEGLGFGFADVEDVEDSELVDYAMTASVYKLPE